MERKKKRDHQLEIDREAKQLAYAKQLADIQTERDYYQRLERENIDDEQRAKVIAQHKKDLEDAKQRARLRNSRAESTKSGTASTTQISPSTKSEPSAPKATPKSKSSNDQDETIGVISLAKSEWQYQKDFEGASNDELDSLMNMIGLENVKQQFLAIKVKVDTAIRQKTDLKDERFGTAFLGNPGTGKMSSLIY